MSTAAAVKKKRSPNWEDKEKMLLREIIKEFIPILENKNTDTNVNQAKKKAWADVQERFNALNNRDRSVIELRQQWRCMKMSAKKTIFEHRRAINATGGGPKPPSPPPEDLDLVNLIPLEFKVDSNKFDSDTVQKENNPDGASVNILLESSSIEQENAERAEPSTSQQLVLTPNKNAEPCTTPGRKIDQPRSSIIKKRKSQKINISNQPQTEDTRQQWLVMMKEEHQWKKEKEMEEIEWRREERALKKKNYY